MIEEVAAGKIDMEMLAKIWGDDLHDYVAAA